MDLCDHGRASDIGTACVVKWSPKTSPSGEASGAESPFGTRGGIAGREIEKRFATIRLAFPIVTDLCMICKAQCMEEEGGFGKLGFVRGFAPDTLTRGSAPEPRLNPS